MIVYVVTVKGWDSETVVYSVCATEQEARDHVEEAKKTYATPNAHYATYREVGTGADYAEI